MPLRHARGHTSTANSTAGMKYHRNSGDANDCSSIPLRAAEAVRHYRRRRGIRGGSGYVTQTMTDMTIADRRVADPRHTTAYVASGVLLLLYGIVPLAWTVYALSVRETPIEEFFRALVWPEV